MNKVLLFNPRSADNKYRIPNSILNIAASIEGKYEWVIVDGNCETRPTKKNRKLFTNRRVRISRFYGNAWPTAQGGYPIVKNH
jgi:hypothetical protein